MLQLIDVIHEANTNLLDAHEGDIESRLLDLIILRIAYQLGPEGQLSYHPRPTRAKLLQAIL